jgi:SAM-dependent methyltransferase
MNANEKAAGYCPVCDCATTYSARQDWLREGLVCAPCPKGRGSVPRERALAHVVRKVRPNWRELVIHECSPARRGVSLMFQQEAPRYVASQFWPDRPLGMKYGDLWNINLEAQTIADAAIDMFVSLDVLEHVFDPASAFREIYRTLRPGGVSICTFPIYKHQVAAIDKRAELREGKVVHLAEPEYHGNPLSGAQDSLVTFRYGYNIHAQISEWTEFDVSITRFASRRAGILGEMTEVIVCEKPG